MNPNSGRAHSPFEYDRFTKREQMQQQALQRAQAGTSAMNYSPIIEGFMEKGIAADQISPRENVFTFNAWKAKGRHVRKGEHGVKVLTWITAKGENAEATKEEGQKAGYKFCKSVTVFHVSQTDAEVTQ